MVGSGVGWIRRTCQARSEALSPVRLSIAIQHHPARAALLGPLTASLRGSEFEVVSDPDPDNPLVSPWRTYELALASTPEWATHRLIVQDDVELCPHFAEVVTAAVTAQPDRLLVMAVCGEPQELNKLMHRAASQGVPWAKVDRSNYWISAICLCWPKRLIPQALTWITEQGWPEGFSADDERIGRCMDALEEYPLATVPSLAAHWDQVGSVTGPNKTAYGHNPARIPCCWPFPGCDPRSIDWTIPPPADWP